MFFSGGPFCETAKSQAKALHLLRRADEALFDIRCCDWMLAPCAWLSGGPDEALFLARNLLRAAGTPFVLKREAYELEINLHILRGDVKVAKDAIARVKGTSSSLLNRAPSFAAPDFARAVEGAGLATLRYRSWCDALKEKLGGSVGRTHAHIAGRMGPRPFELEISLDEADEPTSPEAPLRIGAIRLSATRTECPERASLGPSDRRCPPGKGDGEETLRLLPRTQRAYAPPAGGCPPGRRDSGVVPVCGLSALSGGGPRPHRTPGRQGNQPRRTRFPVFGA